MNNGLGVCPLEGWTIAAPIRVGSGFAHRTWSLKLDFYFPLCPNLPKLFGMILLHITLAYIVSYRVFGLSWLAVNANLLKLKIYLELIWNFRKLWYIFTNSYLNQMKLVKPVNIYLESSSIHENKIAKDDNFKSEIRSPSPVRDNDHKSNSYINNILVDRYFRSEFSGSRFFFRGTHEFFFLLFTFLLFSAFFANQWCSKTCVLFG